MTALLANVRVLLREVCAHQLGMIADPVDVHGILQVAKVDLELVIWHVECVEVRQPGQPTT